MQKSSTTSSDLVVRNSAFTKEEVDTAWKNYLSKSKNNKNQLEVALLNFDYEVNESEITIKVENKVNQSLFNDIKTNLIKYLNSELDNDNIKLNVIIVKNKIQKKPYTNREKFEKLLTNNEILRELVKRFELSCD